jgi:hypothetical protein
MKKFFLLLIAVAWLSLLPAKASAPYPAASKLSILADTIKTIRVEQPTDVVLTDKEQIITWTCNFTDTVRIDLYRNEIFYATIEFQVASRAGINSFIWNVPANFPKGGGYRLVIQPLNDNTVSGKSNLLTIKSATKNNRKFIWIAGGLIVAAGLTFLGIQLAKPKTQSLPEPPLPDGQ